MLSCGYVIIIKHDGRDGSVYPVTTSACSVGRGMQNDIRFRVQSVSEEHCVIYTSEFKPVSSQLLCMITTLSQSVTEDVMFCTQSHVRKLKLHTCCVIVCNLLYSVILETIKC